MDKFSSDYHDYVFKNGQFRADFEGMYRHSAEIPWHQDRTAYSVFSDIDVAILRHYRYNSICEVGCGLGFFANRLAQELRGEGNAVQVTGIDISPTAVAKARMLFPHLHFVTGDLTTERPLPGEQFDLVVIKELLWYVCHKLSDFVRHIKDMVRADGFLYISQSFPETDHWVFQDVIDSPERLKEIFCEFVKPVHYCVEWDWNYNGRPLVHLLGNLSG
jgi:SAM-dependent methyltransferase